MALAFASAMRRQLVLFCLLLAVVQRALGQGIIGRELPCEAADQNPDPNAIDNFSCPNPDPTILECYAASQLCDGISDCSGGSDEGTNTVSLVCSEFSVHGMAYSAKSKGPL